MRLNMSQATSVSDSIIKMAAYSDQPPLKYQLRVPDLLSLQLESDFGKPASQISDGLLVVFAAWHSNHVLQSALCWTNYATSTFA